MDYFNLLREIADCRNVSNCINDNGSNHCCTRIVLSQSVSIEGFQLPEPWNGDLGKAQILFIGSNPGICKDEEYPTSTWAEEDICDFYTHRFSGGKKQWVKNNLYPMLKGSTTNGLYKKNWVRYWASIRQIAIKLTNNKHIIPGTDYAITELVHCKSSHETGVKEALVECTGLYLDKILSVSKARVIVCLGEVASKTIKKKYEIKIDNKTYAFVDIGGIQRYIIFLPHPNARISRMLNKFLSEDEIERIRQFVMQ